MTILQDYSSSESFKFTIITPLYNRVTYLEDWLQSLLRQNHQGSTEILLMDDGSTSINRHDIEAIISKYEQEITQKKYVFHYFCQKENQGEFKNVNMGLQMANGEWIYLLHDDDWVMDDAFIEWENVVDQYPDADLITARFFNINSQNEITFESPALESEGWVGDTFINNFIYGNPLHIHSTIFHKEVFDKIGNFADDIRFYADWEYWRRASKADLKWYYLPKNLSYYREHGNTESFKREQEFFGKDFWKIIERGKKYYTHDEFYASKFYQYQDIFQKLDVCWENRQLSDSLKIIYNMILFSEMEDGIGLECLIKLPIKYKEEIIKMFEFIPKINVGFDKKSYINAISVALKLAVQHQQANRLTEAQQVYHQILEAQPDHPDALYGLGMLAQQLRQPQEAENFLNAAVKVKPNFVKAWFSLGNLHQAQGQLTAAQAAYQQALVLEPNLVAIHNNLGYTLQQQGKFEEAIACYEKALELQPNCIEAEVSLGNILYEQGKLSREQKLHYAQLNHKLGSARKKVGDLKTAVISYKQAIALQPDLLEAYYNLALTLQEQGELEEAITCYQKLLELNANYREVHLNLGKISQQQNQRTYTIRFSG
ncbi:MAG: tetratricopeptide repeat protein [Nostoc sp.]|uniref:tetratricopeptide repeat protein n=1 Tax=Nostoc sp. TaxID=1180 RepID=UPI002FF6C1E8